MLFIDEENGADIIHRRVQECSQGSFGNEDTPFDCIIIQRLNLIVDKDANELEAVITGEDYKMVIIDSLSDIMTGC